MCGYLFPMFSMFLMTICSPVRRYILGNLENKGAIRKGDRLWQMGFGGGFKCNSAVWRALKDVNQSHPCWTEDWPSRPTL